MLTMLLTIPLRKPYMTALLIWVLLLIACASRKSNDIVAIGETFSEKLFSVET